MKRKLLFAAIMAVMGMGQSFAYDTNDLNAAGWTLVDGTTVTLTDLDTYYYLLVDGTETTKSLTYSGIGTDARPVYQLLYDPTISIGQVWKLEASGEKFKLKAYANDYYYCANSWGWNSYMGTNESYTEHEFVLNDGKYYIHVQDEGGTTRALGAWGDYNLSGNGQGYAGTAGNKDVGGSNDRGFYIYRIARTAFTPAAKPSANYAAAGWMPVEAIADWGVAGRKYVFLDYSETGFETEMVMAATENGLPQYQRSNMTKAQWWTTEAQSDGFAFKSVEYGTYSKYDSPWGGNMSADQPGNYFKVSLANGKWALKNTSDNNNWLGRWGDNDNGKSAKNDPFAGEQLAANKGIDAGRRLFNVYAIPVAIDAAEALPATGDMAADTWYYFDIEIAGDAYAATATTLSDIECIEYATGNTVTLDATATTLAATRYYVKSTTANNLVVAATSYSYNIDAAVANPTDGTIKPGQTITVTFNAQTDDPSATPTVDFSGVKFGGNVVAVTTSGTSFTFTIPATVTAATNYTLEIPAGAVAYTGEASSEAATFTYTTAPILDGVYYIRNTDPDYKYKYITRQGNWATRAGLNDWGLAINLTLNDGKYTLQFFDSEQYLYGSGGDAWTDGSAGSQFIVEKVEGGYKFKYTENNKYLYIYRNDGQIYKDGEEGNNVTGTTNVWALETPAEYAASCYARNAQKQVEAAATAAGLTGITTGAQLEAAFTNSSDITIPTVERQEAINKHASNDWNGTPYTFFEETVTGLADGLYKLSFKGMQRAATYARVDAADGARGVIYAYANDAKTQLVSVMEEGATTAYANNYASTRTGLNYPNNAASTYAAFEAGLYNNDIYVYVTGGTLTFGMKTPSRCPNNDDSWTVFGDFTLTYYFDLSTLVSAYETALANAKTTAAKTDKMAASVRTALDNAIDTYDTGNVDETSQAALETAIDALNAAKTKAETSIASYAIIATGSLPNNSTEGWAKTNNGDLKINTWTNTGADDGSFGGGFIENWIYRDNKLGAGKLYYRLEGLEPGEVYYVKMNARTCNEANNTAPVDPVFYVNTTTVDFTTVATLNQQNEWASYYGVVGAAGTVGDDGVLEFGLQTTDACNYNWHAVKDVKFGEAAVAADYTALSNAITPADAKVLGFEANEYAPYKNVAALEALAAAKAIDQTAQNLKSEVVAATAALTDAAWTENTAEVNAIYDGNFSNAPVNDATVGVNGWSAAVGLRQLVESDVENSIISKGMYVWGSNTVTYGETTGYTLPLKANTVYKVTFDRASWSGGSSSHTDITFTDPSGTALGTANENDHAGDWNTTDGTLLSRTMYFVTTTAGAYTMKLTPWGNTVYTNMTLYKVADNTLPINEAEVPAYAPGTYPNVKLARTLSPDYWNTFCSPVDITADEITTIFGKGTQVREMDLSKEVEDNEIPFTAATAIEAGVPYLVKPAHTVTDPTFAGKTVVAEGQTIANGDYKYIGILTKTSLAAPEAGATALDLYLSTYGTMKKPGENGAILKGMRAYFNVPVAAANHVKLFIAGEDTPTSIDEIDGMNLKNAPVYNLAGQRVGKAQKGIYIVNGKKVAIK